MITKKMPITATSLSMIRIHEELSNGKLIPIYQPSCICPNIKTRRFIQAINKYQSLKDLVGLLDKKILKIIKFKSLTEEKSAEERLLTASYEVIVMEMKGGDEKEFLVPRDRMTSFKQISFKYVKLPGRYFYKCVSDRNRIILMRFKYTTDEDHTTCHFTVFNIDKFTLSVTKHDEDLTLSTKDEFRFDILLLHNTLILVWRYQQQISVLNFNDQVLYFRGFTVEDDLTGEYFVDLISGYLTISTYDTDFTDSVFSVKDASQRMTTYYNIMTGHTFNSKKALPDISELSFLEHPTDVIYLNTSTLLPSHLAISTDPTREVANILNQPIWLVLELALPEFSLGKLIFYGVNDGYVSNIIKEIDFTEIFMEYKIYFKTPNEKQHLIKINNSTSQIFLWASQRHIIVINMTTYDIDYILELNATKYKDFKNDLYGFHTNISLDGRCINVFIKKGKDVVHFEQFILPRTISLKEQAKNMVLKTYPTNLIGKFDIEPELKKELLIAY